MKMEVYSLSHHENHNQKKKPNMECFVLNFHKRKLLGRYFSYINQQFSTKIIVPDGSRNKSSSLQFLCFYLDSNKKSLFTSVSNESYKKINNNARFLRVYSRFFLFLFLGGVNLLGNQIFERLDEYQYIYQEVDCLYTLYKNRFYRSIVASGGEIFNQPSQTVQHNLKWKGAEASIARNRFLRKKLKRYYLSIYQKFASTQTLGSAFLERIRKVQNTNQELDLLKRVD